MLRLRVESTCCILSAMTRYYEVGTNTSESTLLRLCSKDPKQTSYGCLRIMTMALAYSCYKFDKRSTRTRSPGCWGSQTLIEDRRCSVSVSEDNSFGGLLRCQTEKAVSRDIL